MSAVKTVIWPGSMLVLLLACLLVSPAMADVSAGDKAPDFQLGNVEGQSTVKLSSYTTEPTLLVFWVSSCSHCQTEVPLLQRVFADLDAKGMNAVGVSADRAQQDARDFVTDNKITFPNAFAGTVEGRDVLGTYGIDAVPAMFVIDKGGTVKYRHIGETDPQVIRNEMEKLGVK